MPSRKALVASVLVLGACVGEDPKPALVTPDAGVIVIVQDGGTSNLPPADAATTPPLDDGGTPPPPQDSGSADAATDAGACSDACLFGCDAKLACKQILPSGVAGAGALPMGTAALVLGAGDFQIDTATGAITGPGATTNDIGFVKKPQTAADTELAIFTMRSLVVTSGAKIRVVGKPALAIVATENISIAGTLSVRGNCEAFPTVPGPGAHPAAGLPAAASSGTVLAAGAGSTAVALCGGGAGGGNGGKGGGVGPATEPANARTTMALGGGGERGSILTTATIVGGARGGNGGGIGEIFTGNINPGGAAGGAVQLIASGTIEVSGIIDAGGCGGNPGAVDAVSLARRCAGASGGGAGGTVFFEAGAVTVTATGRILAHGGGGGGGIVSTLSSGAVKGSHASTIDATPAKGGASILQAGPCPNGGDGSPLPGNVPTVADCTLGGTQGGGVGGPGGGGGPGVIAARTKSGSMSIAATAVVSPAALTGTATAQ